MSTWNSVQKNFVDGSTVINAEYLNTLQSKVSEIISVSDFINADPTGVLDSTTALQNAVNAAEGGHLLIDGDYLISSSIDFTGWSGKISGTGSIKCKPITAITYALNFTGASNVEWTGVGIDMGQTVATLESDLRTAVGIYLKDARDCRFSSFDVTNVRVGEPIYVDGTSSVSPSASHGSKRIYFDKVTCVAFAYNTADIGAGVYLRSDFYVADGGGIYFTASNACKVSDYTLDAAVAYARTTENIYFSNCYFENFDRFGYYNVKNIHIENCSLVNFYTRGHSLSPSCEGVTVVGGRISGNSAQINANYACKDLVFSDLIASGASLSAGQRHSLRCGYGTNRVRFSNITGIGNDTALIWLEGVSDIAFDGVSLHDWLGGNTTNAIAITTGPAANTTSYITRDISFTNRKFTANYGIRFEFNGTGTMAQRGVRIVNCNINKRNEFIVGAFPPLGQIEMINSIVNIGASAQTLDPKSFSVYEGSNLSMKMWDTYAATGAVTYPTFTTVYFPTTLKDGGGGDTERVPPVRAYIKKSGGTYYQPLLYGTDWFIDGTMAALGMINQIRMYTPASVASGDTIAIERIR